jgi:uncharacterized membrane protein YkoI
MRTPRLALAAAASTVALLGLGGTALALGAEDTPQAAVTTSAGATTSTTAPATTAAAPTSIGSAQASAIAVDRVGGGQVTKVERELEHGRVEWKADVLRGGVRYEVRVDAATGTVVRVTGSAPSGIAVPAPAGSSTAGSGTVARSDDGPLHDVGDDHGGASGSSSGGGSDDGAGHDAGDDHGGHDGGHDD